MLLSLVGAVLLLAPPVLPDSTAPEASTPPAEVVQDPTGPIEVEPDLSDALPIEPEAPPAVPPQPDPVATPAPEVEPAADPWLTPPAITAPTDRRAKGMVRVRPPRYAGTGMFIAAGVTFGGAVLVQAIDSLFVGDASFGVLERVFLATSMGLAAGGGINRGHADAYDDTVFRRPRRETRKILISGAVLVGVGATLGLINEGLWWRCVFDNQGPYAIEIDPNSFSPYACRYGLTRGLLDLSSGATAAGLGMLTWALVHQRDTKAYARARVVALRPTFGRGRAGFQVEGRF